MIVVRLAEMMTAEVVFPQKKTCTSPMLMMGPNDPKIVTCIPLAPAIGEILASVRRMTLYCKTGPIGSDPNLDAVTACSPFESAVLEISQKRVVLVLAEIEQRLAGLELAPTNTRSPPRPTVCKPEPVRVRVFTAGPPRGWTREMTGGAEKV